MSCKPEPEPELYRINLVTPENGTIKSSHTEATSGTVVELTATSDAGYEFVEWTITGVTLSDPAANPAKFTMPSFDVQVEASFSVLEEVIAKPSNLKVGNLTTTSATLSWDAVQDALGYEVVVGDRDALRVDTSVYEATGLSPETDYDWRVRTIGEEGHSAWAQGTTIETPAIPAVPPAPPTNLRIAEAKGARTTFEWDAPVESETEVDSYEIEISGRVFEVTDPTFTITLPRNEYEYFWRVRSISAGGSIQSEWVVAEPFTTGVTVHFLAPPQVATTDPDFDGRPRYGNVDEVLLRLRDFVWQPGGTTGWEFTLTLLANLDLTQPVFDIPEGVYTFDSAVAPFKLVSGTSSTYLTYNENGQQDFPRIKSGTITVEGDHTDYTILFELVFNDDTAFYADYVGRLDVDNPDFMTTFCEDQTMETAKIYSGEYFEDAFGDGSIDGYIMDAASEGMGLVSDGLVNFWIGSGWVVSGMQLHAPSGSDGRLPDGTYTIKETAQGIDALWTVMPGSFYSTRKDLVGMWVRHFENDQIVGMGPLVSGTLTSSFANNGYTIAIDAFDDYGNHITGTMTGVGM